MSQMRSLPHHVFETAKKKVEEANTLAEQAKSRIPSEYHDFLVFLSQSESIYNYPAQLTSEQEQIGLWFWKNRNSIYLTTHRPYMSVNGRVAMARDEHKSEGKKLFIHPPVMWEDKNHISVTVESDIYGSATGTSKIFWDGNGANQTNPIENAETSALGRALGFLGYGLVGTGIASAEEVQGALSSRSSTNKQVDGSHETESPEDENKPSSEKSDKKTPPLMIPVTLLDLNVTANENGEPGFLLSVLFEGRDGEKDGQLVAWGDLYEKINSISNLPSGSKIKIHAEKSEDGPSILKDIEVIQIANAS